MSELVKGMRVAIFQDPMTCLNLEGWAVLGTKLIDNKRETMEFWFVKFEGHRHPVTRWVNINHH